MGLPIPTLYPSKRDPAIIAALANGILTFTRSRYHKRLCSVHSCLIRQDTDSSNSCLQDSEKTEAQNRMPSTYLRSEMFLIATNSVTQCLDLLQRTELQAKTVTVLSTHTKELICPIVPSRTMFNSYLVKHQDVSHSIPTQTFAVAVSIDTE